MTLKTPAGVLDYEIAQETASALGRQGRALEAALAALAEFDQIERKDEPAGRARRPSLVAAAAHALWQFIVQREACGLRDTGMVVRMYRVPREVHALMGAVPPVRWSGRRAPPP